MDPHRGPGERVAGADARDRHARQPAAGPGHRRRSGASSPPRSARSSRATGCRSCGTARPSSTSCPARSPTTARSTTGRWPRPADLDALQDARPSRLPARRRKELLLDMVASPNLCSRALGRRAVRPDRHGQHRAGLARGRRCRAAVRGDRPRRRAGHRRQRPLHPPRPVRRRAARAGRGLPQRRGHRRRARSPSPTASTSAAPRTPR